MMIRGGKILLGILIFFLLLGVFIQTPPGKWMLSSIIEWGLTKEDSTVHIGKITGMIPTNFTVEAITLSDRQGEWLQINNVAVKWRLKKLFHGLIYFPTVRIESVERMRQSVKKGSLPELTARILPITIEDFAIERLSIDSKVTGKRFSWRVGGSLLTLPDIPKISGKLLIYSLTDIPMEGGLTFDLIKDRFTFSANLSEGKGGFFGSVLGDNSHPIRIKAYADGDTKAWQGNITGFVQDKELMTVDVVALQEEELWLVFDGKIKRFQRGEVHTKGTLRFNKAHRFMLEEVSLSHLGVTIGLNGEVGIAANQIDLQMQFVSNNIRTFVPALSGKVTGKGSVKGSLNESLSVTYQLNAKTLSVGKENLSDLQLQHQMIIDKEGDHTLNGKIQVTGQYRDAPLSIVMHLIPEKNGFSIVPLTIAHPILDTVLKGRYHSKMRNLKLQGDVKLAPLYQTRFGESFEVDLDLDFMQSYVMVNQYKMQSMISRLQFSGKIPFSQTGLDLKVNGDMRDIASITDRVSGEFTIDATLTGDRNNPSTEGVVLLKKGVVYGVEMSSSTASFRFDKILKTQSGDITLTLFDDHESPLVISSKLLAENNALTIQDFDAQTRGFMAKGDLTLDSNRTPLSGNLKIEAANTGHLSKLLGSDAIKGKGSLNVDLIPRSNTTLLNLDVDYQGMTYKQLFVQHITGKASIADINKPFAMEGRITLKNFRGPLMIMDQLDANFLPKNGATQYTISSSGDIGTIFELLTSGELRYNPDMLLTVEAIEGEVGDTEVSLNAPSSMRFGEEKVVISPLVVNLLNGNMTLGGSLSKSVLDMKLSFNQLTAFAGKLEGDTMLTGSHLTPEIRSTFRLSELKDANNAILPLQVVLNQSYHTNQFEQYFALEDPQQKHIEMRLTTPMQLQFLPFKAEKIGLGPLDGLLTIATDLQAIHPVFLPFDQRLSGGVRGQFQIKGTVVTPIVDGRAEWRNGVYENNTSRSIFNAISMDLVSDKTKVTVQNFTATDGEKGRIDGEGSIEVDPKAFYPIALKLKLENTQLMRRTLLSANVSGTMEVSGTMISPHITGDIKLNKVDVTVPERIGTIIPELQVIEINLPPGAPKRPPIAKAVSPLSFDVNVSAKNQLFLRGRGLDAELKGNLNIKGTKAKPMMFGSLETIRGRYSILSKQLEIKKGVFNFDGAVPPSPYITVDAETKSKDMIARINVTGPVLDPELSFSSEPDFPEDEMLARLMFGQNLDSISPFQLLAVQEAINNVTGKGGSSFDAIGSARQLLSVDQINISQDGEEGGTTVGVGKYIREELYVELQKGSTNESSKVLMEATVSPNITIESEISQGDRSGGSINWKKDY